MNDTKVPENRAYKVTLILLVGLAAFSTAMKDLNRLREMASSVQEFASQWRGTDLVTLNEKPISIPNTGSCPHELINRGSESGSSDAIAGANIDVESDYETITQPEFGGNVELFVSTKPNRDVPRLARAVASRNAPARNSKAEMSAKLRDGHWPVRFEYKTDDRAVTLDLPITMLTRIKADALDPDGSPDSPLSLLGKINRKQWQGKSDNIRREFMIKRFERSFSSRRAS